MGSKWAHADVLDNGPEFIRTLATGSPSIVEMHLISHYSAGDPYAVVVANSVASIALDVADLTMSSVGNDRKMTVAAKSNVTAGASTGGSPSTDLHVALVDTENSKVLLVTDETSDQEITSGNPVNFPSWGYTIPQPV